MNVQERHETQCHIEPGVFIVPLIVMVIYIYMYIYIYIYIYDFRSYASSKSVFPGYYTDSRLSITSHRKESHTKLPSQLIDWRYREISTLSILHEGICR